ncbi:ABC transporter permease [Planctomycetaceae bacterium SCGC AG-212-F19]|nr:ABC transporter permease [Planctomycetaceae bacterium SCGC AG-212-F19]
MSSDKGRRSFVLAVRSLWLHKLRAMLSVLGIIIGTMAVITLMGFGEGSMQDALDDIKRLGATNIIIRSVKPPDDSSNQQMGRVAVFGLTYQDYERFLTIGDSVIRRVPMRIFPREIRSLERKYMGRVVATLPGYAEVNTLTLASGRFLAESDDHYMENVVVLGSKVADALFPFDDPLGQFVRLDKYFYKVVGVLGDRLALGSAGGSSQAAEDFNSDVYIPLQTCKVRYGERIVTRRPGSFNGEQVELNQVTLTIADMEQVRPAGAVVRDLLERFHPRKNDWLVTVPLDRLEEAERARDRYTLLLAVIAGISLLVGGIGIMNIMLATVTERTREIGIRRALGAKRRDITLQFLIEAVVQTSVGGVIGVVLGLAAVFLIPLAWKWLSGSHLPAQANVVWVFVSLIVDIGVGIAFGLYPAWRASRLDPIEALRHE